jgi:hypothetical protein
MSTDPKIQQMNDTFNAVDLERRTELSRILGSYEASSYYYERQQLRVLTWLEISAELGKLIARKEDHAILSQMQDLRREIESLRQIQPVILHPNMEPMQ